ncbi:MAG TPA: fatty acid desaturase [Gemmatimonadaceae bacterium]|nr:fatty acid desaturase [Gemmatimonadaceae bacterium]
MAPSTARNAAARYRTSGAWQGVQQLCTTLIPLAALLWLMYRSLSHSYWITLLLALPAAGFLVRTFIIMHDCSHGSFFPSRRANEIVGFVTGVLTLTPFVYWRRDHALHHASSGDLDRRGHGDVLTLTVDEYLSRSPSGRLKYRLYRNPFILFVFGPLYMLVNHRWTPVSNTTSAKVSVHATNAAILALFAVFSFAIGIKAVLLVYFSVFFIAAASGIWMFYVQHQFEDTYWEHHAEWDYTTAAMRGSSYYKLPRVLEWLTGSIGLHHIHHADPKIPNYNLRRCHDENHEFQTVPQLTFRKSLRTASLKLWDSEQGRLVGFDAVRKRAG